jgi:hypothetical protein
MGGLLSERLRLSLPKKLFSSNSLEVRLAIDWPTKAMGVHGANLTQVAFDIELAGPNEAGEMLEPNYITDLISAGNTFTARRAAASSAYRPTVPCTSAMNAMSIHAVAAESLRVAIENITRVMPLIIMLTPTSVPIAHAELEGHCR